MPLTSIELFGQKATGITSTTPRTVICLGTSRSGTSMVVGAIVGLGVPMGFDPTATIKDPHSGVDHTEKPLADSMTSLRDSIAARNAEHAIWGWQYARPARDLEMIVGELRQPLLIVITRDRSSDTLRQIQNGGMSAMKAVQQNISMEARNFRLVETLQVPTLLVSYDQAIENPREFLDELSGFLKCDLPEDVTLLLHNISLKARNRSTGPKALPAGRAKNRGALVHETGSALIPELLLCVGAQKSGTTWLYNRLAQHPLMRIGPWKEFHYFTTLHNGGLMGARLKAQAMKRYLEKDINEAARQIREQARGVSLSSRMAHLFGPMDDVWYASSFRGKGRFAMDFSPEYADLTDAGHEHIKRVSERRKIIFIMREPLDRALSAVRYVFKQSGRNAAEASHEEIMGIAERPVILSLSRYEQTIEMLQRHHPAEDLHFMFYESMMSNKTAALNEVCDWLGIDRLDTSTTDLERRDNATEALRLPRPVVDFLRANLEQERIAIEARFPQARAAWAGVAIES